jgi:transcriptional regulator with XRE-family HTH domain
MAPPTVRNVVGPVIRRLRNERDWSQELLAARLQLNGWDCTRSWLAKIEAQQVYVKDFELLYFCAAFGKDLDELYSTLSISKLSRLLDRKNR